ncbi:IucA/IucC family C-terminal-domain containing protein [Vibrio atlanticus]|uniref:IucA/IucC family C-terminal-domain containing protein n=1 Tax=Vibrio atlanticus TaxID=693153 RepID=UPI003D0F904A
MSTLNKGTLSDIEWETLTHLGLKKYQLESIHPLHISSRLLLDKTECLSILNKIMPELGAPDLKITASLVIKRIAFLVLAPTLYSMSVYNKGLNLTIDNSVFEYPLNERIWQNGMPIFDTQVSLALDERALWREGVLRQVFSEHLTPLVNIFNEVTGISKRVLWENIAVRIFSVYERRILPNVASELKVLADGDLQFIVNPETHAIFSVDENPLTRFYGKKIQLAKSADLVRIRRTCCYYYKATSPQIYCSNCPLLLKKKHS